MIKNLISLIVFLFLAIPTTAQLPPAVSPPINIANSTPVTALGWCSLKPQQCAPYVDLFRVRSNEPNGEVRVGKYTTMSVYYDGSPPVGTFFIVNLTTSVGDPPGQFHFAPPGIGINPLCNAIIGPVAAERLVLSPTHQTLYPFGIEYHASIFLPNDNAFVGYHLNFQYATLNSLLEVFFKAGYYAQIYNS
jgi:hypothetical protein